MRGDSGKEINEEIKTDSYPVVSGQCRTPPDSGLEQHLQMLVLGDSILWGQGLREQQKSWYRVKCWLQDRTGRVVDVTIKAHSGAIVDRSPGETQSHSSPNREVNLPLPSINEELDEALRDYGDGAKVDLVLLDGVSMTLMCAICSMLQSALRLFVNEQIRVVASQ